MSRHYKPKEFAELLNVSVITLQRWDNDGKLILNNDIYKYDESTFSGSGYIVDTLESSIYSFINSKSCVDSIKTAISFGEDTDTIACITGGLSGLYYGYNKIPRRYIDSLDRRDDIIKLLNNFNNIYQILN